MPKIEITDETLGRLQAHAIPLVDTYDSVLARLLDAKALDIAAKTATTREAAAGPRAARKKNRPVEDHPDLTHTRLISASFGGGPLDRPKWNSLLKCAVIEAFRTLESFEDLKRSSLANLREGAHDDDGYTFLPEIGISLQGMNANDSWENSLRLARAISASIEVELEWRNNDAAAHPGKRETLSWEP